MSVLIIILALVLFLFLFTAFCSSLLYWYETLNTPCPSIPSPALTPFSCLQLFCIALGGYFIGVFLHPVGWFWRLKPGTVKDAGNASRPPVILIHGINDNASVWLYLGHRLLREGYAVSTFSYLSLFTSMDIISSRLEMHMAEVEAAHPGKKPILVGHSLGGILARRWLKTPGNQDRVAGILTLATPHGGSKMAILAPGKLGKNITPSAGLIRELRESAAPLSIPCVSLVTPTDEAVLPAASLLPPQGWRMRITNRTSHYAMLYCPRVARVFLEELKGM